MNGFKSHDYLVNTDIWPYGNWEPNFLQHEQLEQNLSKDLFVDPSTGAKHSKMASKMEIRRTKDRIRKRILRAKETPLASAIRREKNRRRMAAARARKSMQKRILQCVQENPINPEVIAEANRLNRMSFTSQEGMLDPLPQANPTFNKDKPPQECASENLLLTQEMQLQSENLPFLHLQELHPVELQVEKKTETSQTVPITLDDDDNDDDKKADCTTVGNATFYQPLLESTTFHKTNKRPENTKQASPNMHILDESVSTNGCRKQTMLPEIQMLTQTSANLTAISPTIRRDKNKMPLEVTIANKSCNSDNLHVYQSPNIQTQAANQTFETPLLPPNQNQPTRSIRENRAKTDQVADKNINPLMPASGMVTATNASEEANYLSIRHRRNTLTSIEMRRKRDRLRKQLARARESQMEKEIRREKNRRRMAEFRARHRLKSQKVQMENEYEAVTAASWNQMWEQQWTLNEVTPTDEQNTASNLRTHPPETPSVLLPKERRTFVVPNHLESFMSNLSSLWKAGRLCDASISNGTADIMIHKMVLAAVCPKILTELSKTPLDKFQKVTFPSTVSKEALTAFAEYMYSGVLDLDETILAQLKIIAQRLDMKDFEQLCDSHLQTPQLMSARMGSTVSNELQAATDFESAVGLRTQVTFREDMTPIMKLVPVDGHNSDKWPRSSSDVPFPIANPTPTERMLKVKQELADSTTNDSSKPSVKKEPVTLESKVLSDSSAWETLDLLHDQSTQPQGSLPHVESLVSISPLCAKMTNPNPATTSLNFSSPTTTAGSSRPTAPNIIQHGNPPSSSSTSNTLANMTYSQTDNSQVNLLSSYASRTSESESPLTTTAAAIAALTSNSESSTSQTLPIKLPSPLSFYNIT